MRISDWSSDVCSSDLCAALSTATLLSTAPEMFTGSDEEAFQRLRRAAKLTLYGGDCFNYGLLSSGLADLVVEADLKPYDYLAQVPIIAGAGGVMTDWDGRPPGLERGVRECCAGRTEEGRVGEEG